MDEVVAVTVMCALLFLFYVYMLRKCEGDGNADVGAGGGVFVVSSGCRYRCGTCGSGVVSTANDVLELSVVRGVRGVDGVCVRSISVWFGAGWEVWW